MCGRHTGCSTWVFVQAISALTLESLFYTRSNLDQGMGNTDLQLVLLTVDVVKLTLSSTSEKEFL